MGNKKNDRGLIILILILLINVIGLVFFVTDKEKFKKKVDDIKNWWKEKKEKFKSQTKGPEKKTDDD